MTEQVGPFIDFVRPAWTRLHSVARQYVAQDAEAADLVQETLLRAWRNFSTTQESCYRRAWLFVILRNVAVDWQRSSKHRAKFLLESESHLTELAAVDSGDPLGQLPAMSEGAFREFLDDKIAAALDALDPAFREVIILSVAGGLQYREIAETLDCPLGTVMSRMARARRALRERLADYATMRRASREARS